MNSLKVILWGEELGMLVWNPARRQVYFTFNPDLPVRPDVAPLLLPREGNRCMLPVYGDDRRIYQNLPPFIADSLPDSWGNRLFDAWIRRNKVGRNQLTPLYKLMFIGNRGMGALEYEPAAHELEHLHSVNVGALYRLALDVAADRDSVILGDGKDLTMQTLLSVGTSAGGRQMKAIVAIHPQTHQIRSGQVGGLKDYEYWLIKLEDEMVPTTEIEMTFYEMATGCGIEMEECRKISVEGTEHFMTRRFDRKNGEKIHMQSLAAMNPSASSYEDLMETCRRLSLTEAEILQVYRRLVFNVLANNTDDHNKNFAFLLEKDSKWCLAPAYDMTFIFDRYGRDAQGERCMTLYGKAEGITKDDLVAFAKECSIRNPERVISEVADSLSHFPDLALKHGISGQWYAIICATLQRHLEEFGFKGFSNKFHNFTDSLGRCFNKVDITLNSKGSYEVNATIDGKPRRRFIGRNHQLYSSIQSYITGKLDDMAIVAWFAELFE